LISKGRNVGGDQVTEDMVKRPDSAFSGTLHGIKGGALEVTSGITGLLTKPYEGAKQEGVKGLFKGFGKGLLGAVASPFTAVFKMGTSITQGIEGSIVGEGGVSQQGRMRFPRYITAANVIVPYNKSLSEARLILNTIDEKKYSAENIVFFELLANEKEKDLSMVIITEKRVLVLSHDKKVIMEALNSDINYARLTSKNDTHRLTFFLRNKDQLFFESTDKKVMMRSSMYFSNQP